MKSLLDSAAIPVTLPFPHSSSVKWYRLRCITLISLGSSWKTVERKSITLVLNYILPQNKNSWWKWKIQGQFLIGLIDDKGLCCNGESLYGLISVSGNTRPTELHWPHCDCANQFAIHRWNMCKSKKNVGLHGGVVIVRLKERPRMVVICLSYQLVLSAGTSSE